MNGLTSPVAMGEGRSDRYRMVLVVVVSDLHTGDQVLWVESLLRRDGSGARQQPW